MEHATGVSPDGLDDVRAALRTARARGEDGIQVAAFLEGRLVLEAWTGSADPSTGREVDADTLFNVFSVTKAVTATALHLLAARGLVSYDDPVADHWPEFGRHRKESITVRQVLSHRAGIPWMPAGVTPERQADWDWMVRQIEAMTPSFEPGSTNCYHALVWGWIVGELVRRVDPEHRPFAELVRSELLEPLGVVDLHLGLAPELDDRRAVLCGGVPPADAPADLLRGMPVAVYPGSAAYNSEIARRTVNPAAGGIGTARDVARFFAMLAGGGASGTSRLLPEDLVRRFLTPRMDVDVADHYLGAPARVGAYGYWLGGPGAHPLIGERADVLHHPGAGGSLAWAELDTGLAVAVCHNMMHAGPFPAEEHPFVPLADAVRRYVAALPAGATS